MPFEGPVPVSVPNDDVRVEAIAATRRMEGLLVRNGWCQGALTDGNGRMCFIGALHASSRATPGGISSVGRYAHRQIEAVAGRIIGGKIADWNDAPGRTAGEVLDLIGRVRAEFEG